MLALVACVCADDDDGETRRVSDEQFLLAMISPRTVLPAWVCGVVLAVVASGRQTFRNCVVYVLTHTARAYRMMRGRWGSRSFPVVARFCVIFLKHARNRGGNTERFFRS